MFSRDRKKVLALQVRVRDYVVTPSDPDVTLITSRITHCREISQNTKVIIKGGLVGPGMQVMPGNHALRLEEGRDYAAHFQEEISYAHFASRSPYQWISKFVIGWAKVKAAGPTTIASGLSYHYRGPFDKLATEPEAILRSTSLMTMQTNVAELLHQPLRYRGGALTHTTPVDYAMKAVLVMMTYLDELATEHGEMLEWMHGRTNLLPRASLSPAEVLSPPSDAVIRGYRPSREIAMTSEFLTSRSWKFFHQAGPMEGAVGALCLRFCVDGTIGDYAHPNESHWRLDGETLSLLNVEGEPSTRFNYVEHEREEVIFAGPLITNPAIVLCLVEQDTDLVPDPDPDPEPKLEQRPDLVRDSPVTTQAAQDTSAQMTRPKIPLWRRLPGG